MTGTENEALVRAPGWNRMKTLPDLPNNWAVPLACTRPKKLEALELLLQKPEVLPELDEPLPDELEDRPVNEPQ